MGRAHLLRRPLDEQQPLAVILAQHAVSRRIAADNFPRPAALRDGGRTDPFGGEVQRGGVHRRQVGGGNFLHVQIVWRLEKSRLGGRINLPRIELDTAVRALDIKL